MVKDRALNLVAMNVFIVDKDAYLLTADAVKLFSKDVGRRVTVKKLARVTAADAINEVNSHDTNLRSPLTS